jgi:hypothetical protein
LAEVAYVGIARNEPNELVKYAFEVQLLGGNHWETFGQIETHLVAKNTTGSGAGSVGFVAAFAEYPLHEFVVLTHGLKVRTSYWQLVASS